MEPNLPISIVQVRRILGPLSFPCQSRRKPLLLNEAFGATKISVSNIEATYNLLIGFI